MKTVSRAISTLLIIWSIIFALSCVSTEATGDSAYEVHMVSNDGIEIESAILMPEAGVEQKGFVVFARGSGNGDMRQYAYGFFETYLYDSFLEKGIAIVIHNKRGIGKSTGNWKMSSIESRADDLLAVIDYYRKDSGISSDLVGVIGHSQGGWVAYETGSRYEDIDFVISLAGPVVSVLESDLTRTRLDYTCQGLNEDQIGKKVDQREASIERRSRIGKWFPFFQLRFSRNIFMYNPDKAISNLKMPTLIALGEYDNMAEAEESVKRFQEIFPHGTPDNFTVHVVEQGDHFFHITEDFCFDYYEAMNKPYSEDFLKYYKDWLESEVFSQL